MTTAEASEKKFENSELTVTVHRKPASRVEFEMHVSSGIVQAAHKDAVREVVKEVSLPGFRKGRAPEPLVEKHFPKQIDQRWQELIAMRSLQAGEKLSGVAPLSRNTRVSFSMKKHDREHAELSVTFEAEPIVPTVDPKNLELKKVERPVVDEKKVEETIRQMQFFFAKWSIVQDRGVEMGDLILLDIEDMEASPPQKVFSSVRFEVAKGKMAQWMIDLVLGKRTGESADGESVADEDASEEDKASFKPKKIRLTVLAIEHAELPPIDDELAKKLGVNTVTDLNDQVNRILNKQADAHVQEKLREQISDQLLSKYPFELPYSLIERETQFRMRHLMTDPQFQQHWSGMSEQDHQKTIMSIFEQSQKAVRMFYLCRKISHEAKISVSPQDLPEPPNTTIEAMLQPSSQQLFSNENEVQQAEAFSRLLLEKTEDYLIANAVIQ